MKGTSNPVIQAKIRSRRFILGDLIFALLPALILFLTRLSTFRFDDLLTRSDWSYVALILFGQAIVKLVFGVSENRSPKSTSMILILTILVLAFGLVPTGVFLVLIEVSTTQNIVLIILQHIMLITSIFTYFNVGTMGQMLAENRSFSLEQIAEAEQMEKKKDAVQH